jgi:hypothetical protein
MNYHDLGNHINEFTLNKYRLPTVLWESFQTKYAYLQNSSRWTKFKYLNTDNTIASQIDNVPTNKGGIYLFIICPNLVFESQHILAYAGRAQLTENINLRKRIRAYMNYVLNPDNNERPKIRRLFLSWKQYIYCQYITIDTNDEVIAVEREIVDKLLPPFNDEIFDVVIRDAVNAFDN